MIGDAFELEGVVTALGIKRKKHLDMPHNKLVVTKYLSKAKIL
jgi:hypothetical protein